MNLMILLNLRSILILIESEKSKYNTMINIFLVLSSNTLLVMANMLMDIILKNSSHSDICLDKFIRRLLRSLMMMNSQKQADLLGLESTILLSEPTRDNMKVMDLKMELILLINSQDIHSELYLVDLRLTLTTSESMQINSLSIENTQRSQLSKNESIILCIKNQQKQYNYFILQNGKLQMLIQNEMHKNRFQ